MAILGKAAIAMWWDISPAWRAEFEDWHSHEHFPERMGFPVSCADPDGAARTAGKGSS